MDICWYTNKQYLTVFEEQKCAVTCQREHKIKRLCIIAIPRAQLESETSHSIKENKTKILCPEMKLLFSVNGFVLKGYFLSKRHTKMD
jgi:hypothetical protein